MSDRIREARTRVVLIDNYVDDTVLTMLDKRADGVTAEIYTMQISKAFQLDIDKHNLQYAPISVNSLLLEPAGEDPAALVLSFSFDCLG